MARLLLLKGADPNGEEFQRPDSYRFSSSKSRNAQRIQDNFGCGCELDDSAGCFSEKNTAIVAAENSHVFCIPFTQLSGMPETETRVTVQPISDVLWFGSTEQPDEILESLSEGMGFRSLF